LQKKFEPTDTSLAVIGTIILWFGCLFFNAASGYEIVEYDYTAIPQKIMLNSFIASVAAGITYFAWDIWSNIEAFNSMEVYQPVSLCHAILAGLTSITACSNITTASAFVVGTISALNYIAFSKLFQRYKIDDPLESSIVHGICGFWGVLAVGIFDLEVGLFYSGDFYQIEIQLLGGAVIGAWSTLFCGVFFKALATIGRFRVSHVYEVIGIDLMMH